VLDLHTHSNVSDGSDPPAVVVSLAAAAGCSAVALTDHDRLDGVDAAVAAGARLGVEVVPGCELSCSVPAGMAGVVGTMHLLVYWVTPEGDGPLQHELVRLQRVRDERNQVMCLRLGLSYDALLAEAGGMGAGRPHAAALLVRDGRATSIQDAFDRWLGKGRPGYVEKERLSPASALSLARSSGGVPVLAHPLSLKLASFDALRSAVDELRALGLAGVECIYGRYSPDERTGLADLTRALDLAVTGGSDYHGTYKPDLAVGVGRGDLNVPDELLDDLRSRSSR
jgi:predicted metal-dependent phosphoesterase TrpH